MTPEERGERVRRTLLDDLQKVGGLGREEVCARWAGDNVAKEIHQARREALEEARTALEEKRRKHQFGDGSETVGSAHYRDAAKAVAALMEKTE